MPVLLRLKQDGCKFNVILVYIAGRILSQKQSKRKVFDMYTWNWKQPSYKDHWSNMLPYISKLLVHIFWEGIHNIYPTMTEGWPYEKLLWNWKKPVKLKSVTKPRISWKLNSRPFFLLLIFFFFAYIYVPTVECVAIKGKLVGVISLLPTCGY